MLRLWRRKKRNGADGEEQEDELSHAWMLTPEEVANILGVTSLEDGLPDEDVAQRRHEYGPNALRETGGVKLWKIIFHHLVNIMSFVLFVAFVLAMVTQQWVDAGVVMGIIILNAIIGVSQEWKSEKTMEALRKMSAPNSLVIRNGQAAVKVPSNELVPGDIVVISSGDKIPADMRLISAIDLEVDESLLTGESLLVQKKVDVIPEEDTPLGDRKNMVFMSSEVKLGKGLGIVVRIGQMTELGKIAESVGSAKKQKTKLEKRMNWLAIILAVVAAGAIGIVLLGLYLHDTEDVYPEGLQVGVTTAVALIPEALVPVITLGLTLGVRRMAKQKALVRKLAALEQLGNVTDICSDKTGTLTQNKMVATNVWLASDRYFAVTGEGFDPTNGDFVIQTAEDAAMEFGQPSDNDNDEDDDEEDSEYETDEEVEARDEADSEINVVDRIAINKPEYHELKMALLIGCLCNASGIYRKLKDSNANEKKRSWWRWLLCGCGGGKDRAREDQDSAADEENLQVLQSANGDGLDEEQEVAPLLEEQEQETVWAFKGTATEAALVVLAGKMGFDKRKLTRPRPIDEDADESTLSIEGEDQKQPEEQPEKHKEEGQTASDSSAPKMKGPNWIEKHEYPFDATVKLMSVITIDADNDSAFVFSKGAPERLLPKCVYYLGTDGEVLDLDDDFLRTVQTINAQMADKGLRVLALAYRAIGDAKDLDTFMEAVEEEGQAPPREEVEKDLIFVGLVGIKDPPRPGVAEAVAVCHKAGLRVRMVTGDHPSTSAAIARQIGILRKDSAQGLVMTSTEFDAMTDEQLDMLDEIPYVIARCSPESKVKMVQLLHRNKRVVAMTGDGVNDSPAISCSDVGIAMGEAGTEVTKEAADIILVDDDFSTIVAAISEGRRIFANIRKFIVHLLVGNVAEAIVMVFGIASGLRPPIGPLQILWVNLVTGTPPAIALSVEKASSDLMDKKKRPIGESLFTTLTIVDIFVYGLLMGALSLGNYIVMAKQLADHKSAQATCYVTLTVLLLLHAYNCRRLKKASLFSKSFFTRAWGFHFSFVFGLGSVVATLYIPGLNDKVFHDQGEPGLYGWGLAGLAAIVFVGGSELYRIGRKLLRTGLVKRRLKREVRKERKIKHKKQQQRETAMRAADT